MACNKLHQVDAAFPLGVVSAVTGVSGSDKSSLVSIALVTLVASHLGHAVAALANEEDADDPLATRTNVALSGKLDGDLYILRRMVQVDQNPLGARRVPIWRPTPVFSKWRASCSPQLQRPNCGKTLYVLDELTTGLHPSDVDRLMVQLHALADAGNTVVLVEHDMRVVADCDWVMDVEPGAGSKGGRMVATGTPAQIVAQQITRIMRRRVIRNA